MKSYRLSAASQILILALVFGCAAPRIEPREMGDASRGDRVLIATQQSRFKDSVVEGVVREFAGAPVYLKIIDIRELNDESTLPYRAVIIISACRAWDLSPHAIEFANREKEKEKIFLFSTAGDEDWAPGVVGVDAMTSASTPAKIIPAAEAIIAKIHGMLPVNRRF